MTRTYSLVIEGDAGGFSAYVPEQPTVLVTGRSMDELTARAAEAMRNPG
jgi:predicted RNase H-like HicB family nuclease